jgi:hypothetical protein
MILTETATATTLDTAPVTFTCSQCPFARLIEDNRYCCQVSQTASDVTRGHWEATISCFEAMAKAEAEQTPEPVTAEVVEAPIAQTVAPAAPAIIPATPTPAAIAKTDKKLAAIFTGRPKQYQQFLIIREELAAIGVKLGKLINSREDVKGWFVVWDGSPAALYWSSGNGWEISTRKGQAELIGNWEGFDLIEHLDCNGIELPE